MKVRALTVGETAHLACAWFVKKKSEARQQCSTRTAQLSTDWTGASSERTDLELLVPRDKKKEAVGHERT